MTAHLADLSSTGCLLALPLEGSERLPAGSPLHATWTVDGESAGEIGLDGLITHVSPLRCLRGAGMRFGQSQQALVDRLVRGSDAGAISVRASAQGETLSVVGHFGFHMNRAFLYPIRQKRARLVDLSRCTAIDSAGLGLLRIAIDHGVRICGARGRVKQLMEITQIVEAAAA